MNKIFFFLLITSSLSLIPAQNIYADTLTNETFILQTNNINLQTKDTITPTPTPEDLPKPFIFSISETKLDFGQITPTDPTLRTTTINVSPGDTLGFSIFGLEDHELQSPKGKIIPDTTCDSGNCQNGKAATWKNTLTYGFGYSLFADKNSFAPFPNQIKKDKLSPLFSSFANQQTKTTITIKANISASQDIGLYTNTIQLIAVPNF